MRDRQLFSFKSITHRLIFGCVSAALVIYGISYWHARYLIEKTVGDWIIELSETELNSTLHQIKTKLLTIETELLPFLPALVQDPNNLSIVKSLLAREPAIESISLIIAPQSSNTASAKEINRHNSLTQLTTQQALSFLKQCQSQPLWSQPYINKHNERLAISKCLPYPVTENGNKYYILLEINLDWLNNLILHNSKQNQDSMNILKIAEFFIIDKSNQKKLINTQASPNDRVNNVVISNTLHETNWSIGMIFSRNKIEKFQQQYIWLLIFSMFKDMLLMCLVIAFISQLTTKSLRDLNTSTEEMARGNLKTDLPPVRSDDEVGRLTRSFGSMRDSLLIYIDNLKETTAAKQKIESELLLAAQIQRTMLPRIDIVKNQESPYDISAILKPARIVGGDFYDFFLLGSDRLYIIIGDVADKGVPSALQMARTITLIRTLTKSESTPKEILTRVNQALCSDNEDCLFVTVFCGLLELDKGLFTYASGGHDAPILIRNSQARYLELETLPPLGLYEDSDFIQQQELLYANDLLLLYTDGITEAMNGEGRLFSDTRLLQMIAAYPPTNTTRAVRTIEHFCQQFVAGATQSDDITLLALQYLPVNRLLQITNPMEWQLTINSQLTGLTDVKRNLGNILREANLTLSLIENCQLIAEEVLVNIIEYGYGDGTDNLIDLWIEKRQDYLIMTFEDRAKPFNPLINIIAPNLNADDIDRPIGGLGFFLVQELAEKVDYNYCEGKNILTVTQKLEIQ